MLILKLKLVLFLTERSPQGGLIPGEEGLGRRSGIATLLVDTVLDRDCHVMHWSFPVVGEKVALVGSWLGTRMDHVIFVGALQMSLWVFLMRSTL